MIARVLAGLGAVALAASACGGDGTPTVTVLAASSLTDAFELMAEEFELSEAGAGTDIQLVFAGSSALATQIEEGAPADVVATADEVTMARIVDSRPPVREPAVFAENSLVIAVFPGATPPISSLESLAAPGVLVATCAPQVPCGSLTERLLSERAVVLEPISREPNVRSVLTKVLLGEVDAGLVYASDVIGIDRDEVVVVTPTGAGDVTTRYPIAVLTDLPAAHAFTEFVLGDEGRRTLAGFGFDVEQR